jgi:hypothetical protein
MSPLSPALQPGDATYAPFILLRHYKEHRPMHELILTPNFRTSGLLQVNPEALRVFLALLSFQHASGDIYATSAEVATALGFSEPATHTLLEGLAAPIWNKQPLAYCTHTPDGFVRWHPSKQAVVKKTVGELGEEDTRTPVPLASGNAVREHSRRTYGTPQKDVERMVAEGLGFRIPGLDDDAQALFGILRDAGVPSEQAKLLLETCSPLTISQQLDWLPYRDAKSPARFLVAAITHNYDPPQHIPRLRNEALALRNQVPALLGNEVLDIPFSVDDTHETDK